MLLVQEPRFENQMPLRHTLQQLFVTGCSALWLVEQSQGAATPELEAQLLPLSHCVTWGKLLNLSVPNFPFMPICKRRYSN